MAVKKDTTEKVEKKPAVKAAKKAAAEKTVAAKAEKAVKAAPKKAEKKTNEVYFYGVGRRKTSVAQVRLYENEKATDADLIINGKKLKEYFPTVNAQNTFIAPLKAVGMYNKMRATVVVRGGGITGQVEAVRLGITRALVKYNQEFKKALKDLGFTTRDAREVERKKPGLKKARRAPQWAKR